MKRVLVKHVDRLLFLFGLAALAFLALTLNNLGRVAAEVPQELRVPGRNLVALYTLNAGMNQPALLDFDGRVLVEFSGWNSEVAVDGVQTSLWTHAYGVEVDREGNRVYVSWSSTPLRTSDPRFAELRRYQVLQVVTLSDPAAARVEYAVVPNEPIRVVRLHLGLYKWYFTGLVRLPDGYRYLSGDLSREQVEAGGVPRSWAEVRVRWSPEPVSVEVMRQARGGAYAIRASFEVRSPKLFERNILTTISVEAGEAPRGREGR